LLCLGRRTVTGLLSTCGLQFQDWSAAYRLFSRGRLDPNQLFGGVRQAVLAELPPTAEVCVALDDSLLPKRGTKIHGVAWRRDPLGPPFQVNLIRAQRVLQFSAALTRPQDPATLRLVPIDFTHAATPPKPRPNAAAPAWEQYRRECRQANLNRQALARWQELEKSLQPPAGQPPRPLRLLIDGRFTNKVLLRGLPASTTVIGRLRKDAKLHYPAAVLNGRGRRKRYGERAPTPDQLRQDDNVPWQTVPVFAAGAWHRCRVKTLGPLLWRSSGYQRPLRLVVIAPLHYRPRQGSRLLYRQPAFLLCGDPQLDLAQIVQNYIWRWDIEVNFRDQKTLLGVGQAQVRNKVSTQALPALQVASYALLLLAAWRLGRGGPTPSALPPPQWSASRKPLRTSTQRLLQQLRAEVWGRGLGLDLSSSFPPSAPAGVKPENLFSSLPSAVCYWTS
jgi:hypothetical protein